MIYIHVPFCHRKCIYCAFYSVHASAAAVHAYVDALLVETARRNGELQRPVRTVYFGGGTPSLLPADELRRIVAALHRHFDLSQLEEMTLEANPEDLTPAYLDTLLALGFDRLSIGVQSLDDTTLRALNRRHTARQAQQAIADAASAGFRNISVDIIYGLPQGLSTGPIGQLLGPEVTHISAYALTVEPRTALQHMADTGRLALPDDDATVRQYHELNGLFRQAGFVQYEVSNHARPGFHSRHNSRYWDRTPYLGLGPGAHSFDGQRRRWNISDVQRYIDALDATCPPDTLFDEEVLTPADAYNELLMTSLRTVRGLDMAQVPADRRAALHSAVQPYLAAGWLRRTATGYSPTAEGLLHADGMAAALFV